SNDCLVVTVPQAGKVVSAPFIVSGFIKQRCAWMISDGNTAAGTVQLANTAGATLGVPSYVRVHSITNPPRYPLFFTAQINAPVTPVSGAAMLLFSDNAPVPNTKLYQVTLK
ncbi:MAG TPA: hypothetical protein VLB02_00870, partial [Candidatus Paceibacterota bacterium]|nr:hypothetical protein [Candidatus Paceibacterota bacterium]